MILGWVWGVVKCTNRPAPQNRRSWNGRFVPQIGRAVGTGSGARLLTSGARLLTSGARLPTSGDRLPTSGARLLTSGARLLTSGARLLTSGAFHRCAAGVSRARAPSLQQDGHSHCRGAGHRRPVGGDGVGRFSTRECCDVLAEFRCFGCRGFGIGIWNLKTEG